MIEDRHVANRAALAAARRAATPADVIAVEDEAFGELGFDPKRSLLSIYLDRVEGSANRAANKALDSTQTKK